jgi:sterol 3beta-glucosyltransferase
MKRIAILTIGSRGDAQPFVTLALALRQAGYDVVLGAPPDFATLAHGYGVPFHPLGVGIQQLLQGDALKTAIAEGNLLAFLQSRRAARRELYDALNREAQALCIDADVIVYKNGVLAGLGIALQRGVPCVEVRLQPFSPTQAFPSVVLKGRASYGPALNWLSGALTQQVVWQILRADVNAFFQRELGLPALPRVGHDRLLARLGVPVVHPISRWVLPRPQDWPSHLHLVGYWSLPPPATWQPPPEVAAFLAAGEPPVYVGFGSMPSQEPHATFDLVVRALELSRQRGIIAGGWGGLGAGSAAGERVLSVDDIPHAWLFPQLRAVVHHGGAGTTATALRAGVPAVVVPFFADQPFWGWRVAQLGAAPAPLPIQTLTAERLAAAISQAVSDGRMRRRAQALGVLINAEPSIAQTIAIVESTARGSVSSG